MLCFTAKSAIILRVSSEYTAPVGLLGELTIINFVFGVIAFSKSSFVGAKLFSAFVLTITVFAPEAFIISGYDNQNGAKTITSSPIPQRVVIAWNRANLAPVEIMILFAVVFTPFDASFFTISSFNSGKPLDAI